MNTMWVIDSPVGKLTMVAEDGYLCALSFGEKEVPHAEKRKTALFDETEQQLQEYFAKKRAIFTLPLRMSGTPFQEKVWQALREIPYGETRSYQQIAQAVHSPLACRAVGMANHQNPISIIVPCHRVIGKNGSMTGFGGGIEKKEFLLQLEQDVLFGQATLL